MTPGHRPLPAPTDHNTDVGTTTRTDSSISTSLPRRLAGILHADIVAFSRLTHDDEDTAYRMVQERMALVSTIIKNHSGHVCDQTGDNLLALFHSAADAVAAALTIQQQSEAVLESTKPVTFRIGVNLGDVIENEGRAFGHSVNVAARLQALAPTGGICVSEAVRTAIGKTLPVRFDSLGDRKLHNLDEPVRAYVLGADPLMVLAPPQRPNDLRRGPTVAVLPFTTLERDPADSDFLGHGLAIDIVTALSRYRQLFVLAPHTSMALSPDPSSATLPGQNIGADYLVAGNIQPLGAGLRFSVQLIETQNGAYTWADQFDLDLSQLPKVRDHVTARTVATLIGAIEEGRHDRIERHSTTAAYQTLLQAKRLVYRMREVGDNQLAQTLLSSIVRVDPHCAPALAIVALTHLTSVLMSWSTMPDHDLSLAQAASARALEIDNQDHLAHGVFGITSLWQRRFATAGIHLAEALALNPNDADTLAGQGLYLTFSGNPESGAACLTAAVERNPFHPDWYAWARGLAEYNAQHFDRALNSLLSIARPTRFHRRLLAATYAQLGNLEQAKLECQQVMAEVPGYRIKDTLRIQPYQRQEDATDLIKGLSAAGFPE